MKNLNVFNINDKVLREKKKISFNYTEYLVGSHLENIGFIEAKLEGLFEIVKPEFWEFSHAPLSCNDTNITLFVLSVKVGEVQQYALYQLFSGLIYIVDKVEYVSELEHTEVDFPLSYKELNLVDEICIFRQSRVFKVRIAWFSTNLYLKAISDRAETRNFQGGICCEEAFNNAKDDGDPCIYCAMTFKK